MATTNPYVASWLPRIKGHPERTPAEKARAAEPAAHHAAHLALRALQRSAQAGNGTGCADCDSKLSGWAALPHGIFLCIDCAQVHRSLGRHLSQVKAVSTGTYTWHPDEVAAMQAMGNATANAMYCASAAAPPRPAASAARHVKERYITDKYARRKWAAPNGAALTKAAAGPLPSAVRRKNDAAAANSANTRPMKEKLKLRRFGANPGPSTTTSTATALWVAATGRPGPAGTSTHGAHSVHNSTHSSVHNSSITSSSRGGATTSYGTVTAGSVRPAPTLLDERGGFESCRAALHRPLVPAHRVPSADFFFAGFGL